MQFSNAKEIIQDFAYNISTSIETEINETWKATITPNDGIDDGISYNSSLQIVYPGTSQIIVYSPLNRTYGGPIPQVFINLSAIGKESIGKKIKKIFDV